jgi:hypothetical protein
VHELISGAALLWVLSVLPGGLGQLAYSIRDRVLRAVAARRGILVPSLVADKRSVGGSDRSPDEESLLVGALGGAPPSSENGADSESPAKVLT